MLKKIYITIITVLLAQGLFAQQSGKSEKVFREAKRNYDALKYAPAIDLLLAGLKEVPGDRMAEEMLANSYRKINDYTNAVYWYGELTRSGDIKAEWALYYAEVLANKEQYAASEEWYNKYLQISASKDPVATAFSKFSPLQSGLFKDRAYWNIEYLNINTANSEYSPMYYNGGLVFSSNRKKESATKGVFEWDQTPFSDLYYVDNLSKIHGINIDSTKYAVQRMIAASGKKLYQHNDDDTKPTSNDSQILGTYNLKTTKDTLGDYLAAQIKAKPLPGNINSKYNEGSSVLLSNGDIMFTRNNYNVGRYAKSSDGINKLNIYIAKAPDFTEVVPFAYNNDQYSVAHPALNSTGTLLVFSSDMPGGFGGTDLYYCTRKSFNEEWSVPVNMGPVINTKGNEQFPTIYKDSVLFFSSTGHPGLGGLDIFRVGLNGIQPTQTPINLGAPFNSSVDDFGIIMSNDGKSGYFSSNRKGSDDIYSFKSLAYRIQIKGIVIDSLTGRLEDKSIVSIQPEGASILLTDYMGRFNRPLRKGMDYTFTAAKEGFLTSPVGHISTKNITSDTTLTVTLKLNTIIPKPIPKPVPPPVTETKKSFSCDSIKEIVSVKKIYYDLDKSNIRSDAYPELDHLIGILLSHPTVNVIVASHCDTRASVQYNLALSQRRSQSARAYLMSHGVNSSRIQLEYYGKSRLVTICPDGKPCPEADQQLNRRTEFVLIKDGKELQEIVDCVKVETIINTNK